MGVRTKLRLLLCAGCAKLLVGARSTALALVAGTVTATLAAVAVAAAAFAARAVGRAGAGRSVGIDTDFAQFILDIVFAGYGTTLSRALLAGLIS